MINRNIKYTYRDYINLSESETERYELIEGELYMVPSPIPMHQVVVLSLAKILDDFAKANDRGQVFLAPLDVVLSDQDVLQPDIMFVSKAREGIVTERNIRGAPDLVMEVLSPGTAERDRTIKRARYLRFGVREYWIVDPQSKSIEVLQAGQTEFETVRVYSEGTIATSPLLEGVQVDVSGLFA